MATTREPVVVRLGLPADTMHDLDPRMVFSVSAGLCALSVVGALGMIVPFVISPTYRRLRHRLIFGLAVSDFVTAMAILVPTCIGLSGAPPENDAQCRAAGFLYLTFVLAATFWTLAIAGATYALLVHPLSRFTDWLSRPKSVFILGVAFWAVGAIITGAGYAAYGFGRTGTICFFGDNAGQFGNLVLLLPRVAVFAIVIFLYVRLYFFFRKSRSAIVVSDYDEQLPEQPPEDAYCPLNPTISSDGSKGASSQGTSDGKERTTDEKQSHLFGGWTWSRHSISDVSTIRKDSKDSQASTLLPAYSAAALRRSSEKGPVRCWQPRPCPPSRQASEGVPWSTKVDWKQEKLSLVTDVDAATAKREEAPASPRSPRTAPPPVPPIPATLPAPIPLVPISSFPKPAQYSSIDQIVPLPPPSAALPNSPPPPAPRSPPSRPVSPAKSLKRRTPPSPTLGPSRASGAAAYALALTRSLSRTITDATTLSPTPPSSPPLPPRTPRAPTIPSGQVIVAMGDAKRRASERKMSTLSAGARQAAMAGDFSLETVLDGGSSLGEESHALAMAGVERKRRMSAQEMNRKASMLMLLYPLAYMVCFSISLGRLINDISAGPGSPTNDLLNALSKWFIYASGFVDCIVFLVIEGGVRRFYR